MAEASTISLSASAFRPIDLSSAAWSSIVWASSGLVRPSVLSRIFSVSLNQVPRESYLPCPSYTMRETVKRIRELGILQCRHRLREYRRSGVTGPRRR